MEFEKEVKKIVDDNYGGDGDKFLSSIKMKTILFLLFGGFSLIISMMIYKNSDILPISTITIGSIFMIIGIISHYMYNQSFKSLNK
jgi:hypothetical protein